MPSWLRDPRRHSAVFALALPMVFSNVTTPLLGLVDTWVIGHLGQAWFLGGVSVGATLINLLFWLLGFLRMSTTGLTAQAQGAASVEGQLDTLARALGLAVGLGLALLLLVLPFLPAIIGLSGGSPEVQGYAGDYVSVRIWSAPAALCNLVIMGWLLGMQDARSPMLLLILSNLVNMVLDAWFVLGLGWQVRGVAAASLLADYSSLGVGLWLVSRRLRQLSAEVLHGIDLQVRRGEFIALMGPSGSGKSTLLNILGLLESMTSGSYRLDGEAVQGLQDAALTLRRRRTLGFVFQFHHLLPAFSALENMTLPALMAEGRVSSAQREHARSLLAAVGLAQAMDKRPGELSGGMQQRVAIARALVMNPPLVLADEPTGNLDTASSAEVFALLRRIHAERGTSFVVVTHDPRLAARCDRLVELIDGRIARDEAVTAGVEPAPSALPV